MVIIAKSINEIPIEKQQTLLSKEQLIKRDLKYIQTKPRFRFEYDKQKKEITTNENLSKILQNTVGLKRFVKHNVSYPYGYVGEEYYYIKL